MSDGSNAYFLCKNEHGVKIERHAKIMYTKVLEASEIF
jgi:hypothetical protein